MGKVGGRVESRNTKGSSWGGRGWGKSIVGTAQGGWRRQARESSWEMEVAAAHAVSVVELVGHRHHSHHLRQTEAHPRTCSFQLRSRMWPDITRGVRPLRDARRKLLTSSVMRDRMVAKICVCRGAVW